MANPHRGEVSVTLGGVFHAARPDYTAIVAWEERAGRTSTELLMRIGAGVFGLRDLTAVIHAALVSGGARLSVEQVGQMIVEEGQTAMLKPVGLLLHNALTGGKEPKPGEPEAAETGVSPSAA